MPTELNSPVFAIARLCLVEAWRTRFFVLVIAIGLLVSTIAAFLAALAATESDAVRAGTLGGGLRILAAAIFVLFVVNSMAREFREKGLELALSLPIDRTQYYLGKLLGFSLIAVLVATICAAAAGWVTAWGAALAWSFALACELTILAALSLLVVMTFTQTPAALAVIGGVYILARAIAAFQLMGSGPLAPTGALSQQVINRVLDGLAFILPELHRFAASEWLIYGHVTLADLGAVFGQTVIYVPLLSAAALFDLWRRNF